MLAKGEFIEMLEFLGFSKEHLNTDKLYLCI